MDVVVVSAVRTPFGRRNGALRGWHSVELLSFVLDAVAKRIDLDPQRIDHVVAACATPVGEQAWNIGRGAVLGLGWPESVPAGTVDAQAVSGQVAVHNAVAMVQSGMAQVVVAAGVESATRVPLGASIGVAVGKPFGPRVHDRYAEAGGLVPPGVVGETMAAKYGITRDALDAYALMSHERAKAAQETGASKAAIEAIPIRNEKGIDTASSLEHDELSDAASVTTLSEAFVPGGSITAGNMAFQADGAAAIVVVTASLAKKLRLTPLARITGVLTTGTDMLHGDCGNSIFQQLADDDTRVEMHEDSAATPLAFIRESQLDAADVNPNGGSVAIGDAAGATGVRLVASIAHAVANGKAKRGVALTAGAGGMAAATRIES